MQVDLIAQVETFDAGAAGENRFLNHIGVDPFSCPRRVLRVIDVSKTAASDFDLQREHRGNS